MEVSKQVGKVEMERGWVGKICVVRWWEAKVVKEVVKDTRP
jgi:hypothetical protein